MFKGKLNRKYEFLKLNINNENAFRQYPPLDLLDY